LTIASVDFEKLIFSVSKSYNVILKAEEIQFLENNRGDFKITIKKDSKLHKNVFSAIKKVGHRGYLSAKTAFLVDLGHIDGDAMLSW
jgi:hypothetical protein